jgi:hypothetical protein
MHANMISRASSFTAVAPNLICSNHATVPPLVQVAQMLNCVIASKSAFLVFISVLR